MPGAELYLYRDEGGTHLRGSHPHPYMYLRLYSLTYLRTLTVRSRHTPPCLACSTPASYTCLHVPASPCGFGPSRGGRGHHTRTRVVSSPLLSSRVRSLISSLLCTSLTLGYVSNYLLDHSR